MDRISLLPTLHNIIEGYGEMCSPFCREMNIPQTGFDILMFIANHPEYPTARDIIRYRGIRPNLVSLYVDRLVNDGYLERHPMDGNRRCIILTCTERAQPIIEEGRRLQREFYDIILDGVHKEDIDRFTGVIEACGRNIDKVKEKKRKNN